MATASRDNPPAPVTGAPDQPITGRRRAARLLMAPVRFLFPPRPDPSAFAGEALSDRMRVVERRDWWLWLCAVLITLILTLGIASFILPTLHSRWSVFNDSPFSDTVLGLVGLVVLFDVYTAYQHFQIQAVRKQMVVREELFRVITENAADMIAVVDVSGKRIYNSPSYERILGYTNEDLENSRPLEQVHPDDRDKVGKAATAAVETGVGQSIEYRMRHKNGNWRILESRASTIRNKQGQVERLVIVNRDVTERKEVEAAIHEREEMFRSLVEGVKDYAIFMLDPEGRVTTWNAGAQRITGFSAEEVIGEKVSVFLHTLEDMERQHGNEELKVARETGRFEEEGWRVKKDGNRFWANVNVTPLWKEPGELRGFSKIIRDGTDRRQLEEQFRQAQKMEAVGRLSGGVAHDFNNLLGVIIGYGEVLQTDLPNDHPLKMCVEEVLKAGHRAAGLTRQLLAFSRQQVLDPKVMDLNAVVHDMEKMLKRLIGEDVILKTDLDPKLARIKADQSQIEQVILNLTVNGRDAMPKGGRLTLTTENFYMDANFVKRYPFPVQTGDYVLFTVSDTGIGMDAATRARVFEPFFTTKEKGKGTGLGLSMVYGVVKQSGGYIDLISEPGAGATFKIYLPKVDAPISATEKTELPASLRGRETVLLVEDESSLRVLAAHLLQSCGYNVLEANCGEDAIKVSEREKATEIHLLLTDVVMPGISGRVLADQLVKTRPGMRVVYTSGYTGQTVGAHGVLAEGSHFLPKPFTREALARKVREALDGRMAASAGS